MKPTPRLRHVPQDTLEDALWMFLLAALFLAAPEPFFYCKSEFLVLESQTKIFTLIKARGQDFNPIPCLGEGSTSSAPAAGCKQGKTLHQASGAKARQSGPSGMPNALCTNPCSQSKQSKHHGFDKLW